MIEEKFDDLVEDLMKNPRFREEYDALKPEFDAVRAEMDARKDEQCDLSVHTRAVVPHAVPAVQ